MFWRVVQLVPTMDGRPSVASERMFIREALASEMPPAFASTTSATSSSCPLTVLTSSQQEIVNSFAEKSHMTPKWSQRCLERNNWDFSKAADYFIHLDEAGKIPGEAFL
ncbi:nuclear RNA export factor 1-like [Lampetra planeri]